MARQSIELIRDLQQLLTDFRVVSGGSQGSAFLSLFPKLCGTEGHRPRPYVMTRQYMSWRRRASRTRTHTRGLCPLGPATYQRASDIGSATGASAALLPKSPVRRSPVWADLLNVHEASRPPQAKRGRLSRRGAFFCSLLVLAFVLVGFSVVILCQVQQLQSDSAVIHTCGQCAVFVGFHSEIVHSEGHEATPRRSKRAPSVRPKPWVSLCCNCGNPAVRERTIDDLARRGGLARSP